MFRFTPCALRKHEFCARRLMYRKLNIKAAVATGAKKGKYEARRKLRRWQE